MKIITKLIIDVEPEDRSLAKAIKGLGSIVHDFSRIGQNGKVAITIWTDSLEERTKIIRRLRAALSKAEVTILTTQYFSG